MKLPGRTRILLIISVIFLAVDLVAIFIVDNGTKQAEYTIWNIPVDSGQAQNYKDDPNEVYSESIIQYVEDGGVIQAQTIDDGIAITFKVGKMDSFLRKSRILPIIIDCVKKEDGTCDPMSPYQLIVGAGSKKIPAKAFLWKWYKKLDPVWVAHGPGDGDRPAGNLAIEVRSGGKKISYMELRTTNPDGMSKIAGLKRDDLISSGKFFRLDKPYNAYVNGVEMTIVSMTIASRKKSS